MPRPYTKVEQILHDMLHENTGVHMLDSGGKYGRHYEKNRLIKNFLETPRILIEHDGIGVNVMVNIFHFLRRHLDRDDAAERLESEFYQFANLPENESKFYPQLIREFANKLQTKGWTIIAIDNTYNAETFLNQDFYYALIRPPNSSEDDESAYIILSVHNGADIRGGYTSPKVFRVDDIDNFYLDMTNIAAACNCDYYILEAGDTLDDREVEYRNGELYCKKCSGKIEFSMFT